MGRRALLRRRHGVWGQARSRHDLGPAPCNGAPPANRMRCLRRLGQA